MNGLSSASNYIFSLKKALRGVWPGYFAFRYLNTFSIKSFGPVGSYSVSRWKNVTSPLMFKESKYIELFEMAEKSKYIAANLVSVDIADVSSAIDSYREGYPFTVRIF